MVTYGHSVTSDNRREGCVTSHCDRLAQCGCKVLCLCPSRWEYTRTLLGYTAEEMADVLRRAR